MYQAEIYITLKEGVLDPQGSAVEKALHAMDFAGVREVRIGKYMQVSLEADSLEAANRQVEEMCARLLANPVIEEFRFHIREAEV